MSEPSIAIKFPLAFRALVVRTLEEVGFDITEWQEGGVALTAPDETERFLNLTNLFKQVELHPAEQHETLIRDFVQSTLMVAAPTENELPQTLEEGAEHLMLRLGPPHPDPENSPWSVVIDHTEDLYLSLVFDMPRFIAFVTKGQVEASSTDVEKWIHQAYMNLRNRVPENWLNLTHPEEGIYQGNIQDGYDAARALVLCDLTQSDELGWIVAMPNRDLLLARKVEKAGVPYFHLLKFMARDAMQQFPYPISDELFWVRPGMAWVKFGVEILEDRVNVYPPAEFAAALAIEISTDTSDQPSNDSEPTGQESEGT